MNRRARSILIAVLVLLLTLPAVPALASANASAALTSNAMVNRYPGEHSYTIQVNNQETSLPIVGGTQINWVTIFFPSGSAGVRLRDDLSVGSPPSGWDATPIVTGDQHAIRYRGGSIAAGGNTQFTFPTNVRRPLGADLTGEFEVLVSSDNGATARAATPTGTGLAVKTMILEIVSTPIPIAPHDPVTGFGVTDRTGTGGTGDPERQPTVGQLVTYQYQVRNHARGPVSVRSGLASSNPSQDVPSDPVTVTLEPAGEPGDVGTVNPTVQLGTATSQRNTAFTASAVTTDDRAVAPPVNSQAFTVQVPVDLNFSNLQPLRVKSGPDSSRQFSINVQRTGGPTFRLDTSRLAFGSNDEGAAGLPRTLGSGTSSLSFTFEQIVGSDGLTPTEVRNTGLDDNFVAYNIVKPVQTITIDNLAPVIRDLLIADVFDQEGDLQIAFKDSDPVQVSGCIDALGQNDLELGTLQAVMEFSDGSTSTMSVSNSPGTDGCDRVFTATGNLGETSAVTFRVSVQIQDVAQNVGSAQTLNQIIDNERPILDENSGRVIADSRADADGNQGAVIRIQYTDNLPMAIRGGCDVRVYYIDGRPGVVRNVYLSPDLEPESRCSGTAAMPNPSGQADQNRRALSTGVRYLHLAESIDVDDTPRIRYAAEDVQAGGVPRTAPANQGHYPAKDGVGLSSLEHIIDTVSDVLPVTPELLRVERLNRYTEQFEHVPQRWPHDDGTERYFVHLGGDETVLATVGRVRVNYTLSVRDATGTVVYNEFKVECSDIEFDVQIIEGECLPVDPLELQKEGRVEIFVPIGDTDGVVDRFLHLHNGHNLSLGEPLPLVLDSVEPTLAATDLLDDIPAETPEFVGPVVKVTFSEPIVDGHNDINDWFFHEEAENQDGETFNRASNPNNVAQADHFVRYLDLADRIWDPSRFLGVEYRFDNPTRRRYEDRAGNRMQNQTLFPPAV